MKKLIVNILLFVFSLGILHAQTITIGDNATVAGAGTILSIPVTASTGTYLKGFELRAKSSTPFTILPFNFYLGDAFYQNYPNNNWICPPGYFTDTSFTITAVGDSIFFANGNLGTLQVFIPSGLSGNYSLSEITFFDGQTNWSVSQYSLNIINLPVRFYGDVDRDNKDLNIADGEAMWPMIGTIPLNDTTKVITNLSGQQNGPIPSWHEYLLLMKINNPAFRFPVFQHYYYNNGGMGKIQASASTTTTPPVDLTWRIMPNGNFGLYVNSDTRITNYDLTAEDSSSASLLKGNGGLFKQISKIVYSVNMNRLPDEPILTSKVRISLKGVVNEGRIVTVSASATGIVEEKTMPASFTLEQNYPNPFNPTTTISYQLSNAGFVNLKVYDMSGKEVATLVNEGKSAGKYKAEFNGFGLSSGVYFYELRTGDIIETKKMLLTK